MSDDEERERLVKAVENNMKRVDEAFELCEKAEADFRSAGRDWQASVMALRDYDARQPRDALESPRPVQPATETSAQ